MHKYWTIILVIISLCNVGVLFYNLDTHESNTTNDVSNLIEERTQLLIEAMYNSSQTQTQLKIGNMSEYLTDECLEEYKTDIRYDEELEDVQISSGVINTVLNDDQWYMVQEEDDGTYTSLVSFKMLTEISYNDQSTSYTSDMMCKFIWTYVDNTWLVSSIEMSDTIVSSIETF